MNTGHLDNAALFTPAINRSMKVLDRAFFNKTVTLAALTVLENKNISSTRKALLGSKELLDFNTVSNIVNDASGKKSLLLQPGIEHGDSTSWSPVLAKLIETKIGELHSHEIQLNYDNWNAHDILEAILPEVPEEHDQTPTGFTQVGHVAHMNLREAFLPYKDLIAQVIMDKNPKITTVINKTEDVGSESVFRTFPYEVLAGPDDLNVEVSDSNCIFQFDFGKVYWNSRLNTEHNRIIAKFGSGEAVCDVMAGVGPFAVPAGKQGVFVWANDLNPHCYEALQWAIKRNKVVDFVTARCADGRDFIRSSTEDLRMMTHSASFEVPRRSGQSQPQQENSHRPLSPQAKRKLSKTYTNLTQPQTFSHFVMNLPATAVTFLNAFRGLYRGHEADFTPTTAQQLPTDFTPFTSSQQLPMIHVYLFTTRHDDPKQEHEEVCEVVSKHLGSKITPDMEGVELFDVRLVSPKKRMYCASFRLPPEVAFAAA